MARDWDLRGDELASESIARGEPTAWFDRLYAEGAAGQVSMPWDRTSPHPLLEEWASARELDGSGKRAVVVGCGLGADAEYLSSRGYSTVAFDIATTAVELALARNPGTSVDYRVADLLALPGDMPGGFDLVVEIFTLQALPDPPRSAAVTAVASLVARGGTMLAVAFRDDGSQPLDQGPPFVLTRDAMEGLAVDGLELVGIEGLDGPRWRAEYHRPR